MTTTKANQFLTAKQLRMVLRVSQVVNKKPGIYRFSLVHETDGRWRLAWESDAKLEELGDS